MIVFLSICLCKNLIIAADVMVGQQGSDAVPLTCHFPKPQPPNPPKYVQILCGIHSNPLRTAGGFELNLRNE